MLHKKFVKGVLFMMKYLSSCLIRKDGLILRGTEELRKVSSLAKICRVDREPDLRGLKEINIVE